MSEGTLVVITGKIDDRIRTHHTEGLVIGTLWICTQTETIVLMGNGELWRGLKHEIARIEEQLPAPSEPPHQ